MPNSDVNIHHNNTGTCTMQGNKNRGALLDNSEFIKHKKLTGVTVIKLRQPQNSGPQIKDGNDPIA